MSGEAKVEGLYAILGLPSERLALGPRVEALIAAGVRWLQLRYKGDAPKAVLGEALAKIDTPCVAAGVRVVLNDAGAAALELRDRFGADSSLWGVHLGQGDLLRVQAELGAAWRTSLEQVELSLGLSTHRSAEVRAAQQLAPAYIGFGPVWETSSKSDTEAVAGLEGLREACTASRVPVVAIGGVNVARAGACAQAGAAAVASISAIDFESAQRVQRAASELARAFRVG